MKIYFSKFKTLILPIQKWLLGQGRCVGCGKPLKIESEANNSGNEIRVDCSCRRIYFYNAATKTFRRALIDEVK